MEKPWSGVKVKSPLPQTDKKREKEKWQRMQILTVCQSGTCLGCFLLMFMLHHTAAFSPLVNVRLNPIVLQQHVNVKLRTRQADLFEHSERRVRATFPNALQEGIWCILRCNSSRDKNKLALFHSLTSVLNGKGNPFGKLWEHRGRQRTCTQWV